MKNLWKNYSFAIIELILYALAHMYTGFLGDLFYILFCIVMMLIVGIGFYRIYTQNHGLNFKQYKGFYLLLGICILYAITGIIRTLVN